MLSVAYSQQERDVAGEQQSKPGQDGGSEHHGRSYQQAASADVRPGAQRAAVLGSWRSIDGLTRLFDRSDVRRSDRSCMAPHSQDNPSNNDPNDGQHHHIPLAALINHRCRGVYGLTIAPVFRAVLHGKMPWRSSMLAYQFREAVIIVGDVEGS